MDNTPKLLHVDDGGDGLPPFVFVHSGGGTSAHWTAQLRHVRKHRRALAVDLRGHGRSTAPAGADFSVPTLAADLQATLDQLRIERVILVGHSLGGAVCVAQAGATPERIAGLLLVDPSSDGRLVPKDQAAGLLNALRSPAYQPAIEGYWATLLDGASEATRARVLEDLRATPPETMVGVLEALLSFDPVTPLRRYQGPRRSLITHHNETPGALHALVPGVEHRRVDGTSHWIQLDAPEVVNAALTDLMSAA